MYGFCQPYNQPVRRQIAASRICKPIVKWPAVRNFQQCCPKPSSLQPPRRVTGPYVFDLHLLGFRVRV